MALCIALAATSAATAAPLKVVGRFLQDAHGNNILMRGVNVPVYKSGYDDDLDAVAGAIALTKTNVVRLEWFAVPPAGTLYSLANLDRAIQKFYDLGIVPVVMLYDLTNEPGQYGPPGSGNARNNDRALFANTITAFLTRGDVVALLDKHRDHLVINLANEWGSSFYDNGASAAGNFLQNYTDAIAAIRNAGVTVPLMVDAPKGWEYQFLLDHGAALLAADPQHNTMLSAHAYWAPPGPSNPDGLSDAAVNAILDAFKNSGLPIVLGEASSNAWTTIACDPVNYVNLLTRANANAIGYLFWAWYEDGQCWQSMNITRATDTKPYGDGVTLPTAATLGYGYDALKHPQFGIDTAQPATLKADFSPVGAPVLLETSFAYDVTSTDDHVTRAAAAQLTRLDNFGAGKRPVVVLMPGWGGAGNVNAVRDAQAVMFANNGYVAVNIGFHQTNSGAWYSDIAESVKAALDSLCLQSYADCSAVLLTGQSYGGTQTHPVVRFLHANASFDGSAGANAGRKVVGILGQDSGYTLYWAAPTNADAVAYSIAMIENLGDGVFPVDTCEWGNCGARNRADYHQAAAGSQYVLSHCPAGGWHGSRGYADWDAWVLAAAKTMLHVHRNVPTFAGYVPPSLPVGNTCVTTAVQLSFAPAALAFGGQSSGTTTPPLAVTVTNTGGATVTVGSVTASSQFAQANNCMAIAPGGSCTINVTFTPAPFAGVLNATAAVSGSLTVGSTASSSPHTLPLAGTAEKSLVMHYYRSILNRAPEPGGQEFWKAESARLQALGANVNEIWFVMANYFFNSPEYITANKSNAQFLTDVYNTFFNRPPDPGGFDYWMSQVNAGLSREGVIFWFMFSGEFRTFTQGIFGSTAARPEVDMVMDFFRGILNRFPDTDAYNYWVGQLRQAQCLGPGQVYAKVNEMSYMFLFSLPEYGTRNRNNTQFVSDMYNAFLRRGGADSEVDFWINQLNTGAKSRNTVRSDFINTPEFGGRVQAVINAGCAN